MNRSADSQFDNKFANQIDEHDEPTEPIPPVVISASAPTVPNGTTLPQQAIPFPLPHEQPFPQQQIPVTPQYPLPLHYPPANGAYPYLPPAPVVPDENRPAGGVTSVSGNGKATGQPVRARRSMVPLAVGIFFVAVQMLLLIRFVLKLLNFSSETSVVGGVYGVSNVFVLPFRLLFLQIGIPNVLSAEIYTLLAIVVYGIVSRIIVHILKAIMTTR